MLRSMTGFGRAICTASIGRLTVEIQSVNRKYFEVFISLPKEFGRFEQELRKWVSETVSRGQLTIRVFFTPNIERIAGLLPDLEILKRLKQGWEKICGQLDINSSSIDLPFLVSNLPQLQRQDFASDEDLPELQHCVQEALDGLLKMKEAEGKALAKDLEGRLKELVQIIEQIESLTPDATSRMRQKLIDKMAGILKPGIETEERLLREVALFAERVDIAEEITRFRSHVIQFKGLLNLKDGVVGRKMDFMIQEMGREVNTIGSKSMDSKIAHLVVEMKSELEKMREQIQNIE